MENNAVTLQNEAEVDEAGYGEDERETLCVRKSSRQREKSKRLAELGNPLETIVQNQFQSLSREVSLINL